MIINTGFEFETQGISMALWKNLTHGKKCIYQPVGFFKKTLKESRNSEVMVQIYPDDFKKNTRFSNDIVQPFIEKYSSVSNIQIDALQENFIIPINKHDLQNFFTHAEFIVTYPKYENIHCSKKTLLNYLLNKTKDAVIDIRDSFTDWFHYVENLNRQNVKFDHVKKHTFEFPYNWISKSRFQDIIFFMNDDPKYFMSKFRFVVQTTIGVPLLDAPKVMKYLTSAFTDISHNSAHDKIDMVESYSVKIFKDYQSHWQTDPDIFRCFLFLLFYSAITQFSRKSQALFVIRLTMFDLAKSEINAEDIDFLYSILLNDYFDDPVAKYITDIYSQHQSESISQFDKKAKQNVLDVTTFPYNKKDKIVFIEFRGFKSVLTHQCKGTTHSNLVLNDILFCKPF